MKKFVKDYIYLLKEGYKFMRKHWKEIFIINAILSGLNVYGGYKFKSFTRSTNKEEETLN